MNKKTISIMICTVFSLALPVNACAQVDSGQSQEVYPERSRRESDRAYNQGVDFYHKLDYNKSADSFMQSINTEDNKLEQYSAYNLGSAFFQQALEAEKQDPQASSQLYKKAVDFFKRSIEIDPDDMDAKYNFELAKKKAKDQEQKAQQQKDKQDKQDKSFDSAQDKSFGSAQDKQDQKDQKKDKDENKPFDDAQGKQPQNDEQKDERDKPFDDAQGKRRQMTEEEAKMLLDNFQQAEQQKKKQDLYKAQQQTVPGVKGW